MAGRPCDPADRITRTIVFMANHIQNILLKGSLLEVLIAVCFAGAVASLSSCTIVRLPVLLGLVSTTGQSKHRGFLLSIAFSCGLIISYTLIGMIFGAIAHIASRLISISMYLYLFLGFVMLLGGLFFAGLIPFLTGELNRQCEKAVRKVKTLPSALIFGMLFAFLEMPACPCCGAVLLLIASLIAIKGSLFYSGTVFFSFALGQSFPILVMGFSTSVLKHVLPKTQHLEGMISFLVGNIIIVSGVFLIMLS
ncbi:MAG: sulfite exporter TauE/SafE family protein [Candidatus Omnitrophica bacterium]|nr:sulfite exporter TauE/SafE family protein [Candidatus Omnitrophota bacterium]